MKIAIDISQIIYGTGVSVYTKKLVEGLVKIDHENEYVLFGSSFRRKKELTDFANSLEADNVTTKFINLPPSLLEILWNRLHVVPIETFVGKVDIVHTSDWTDPPSKAKKVSTIHDLAWSLFPSQTPVSIRSVHERKLKWIKNESNFVIVPSESTKNDAKGLGIKKNIIKVIPEGVDEEFKPVAEKYVAMILEKYGIKGKYLLAVGTAPRKNLKNIIKAVGKRRLVVVGERPHGASEPENVDHVGFVPRKDLLALYSGAEGLVYTPTYEGFGLPVLEAFACKCPVVCSNISSLPEVAGKAAVLVNPISVSSVSDGIEKVLKNRKKYVALGLKQVKMFSFEKMAKDTLKIYNSL